MVKTARNEEYRPLFGSVEFIEQKIVSDPMQEQGKGQFHFFFISLILLCKAKRT